MGRGRNATTACRRGTLLAVSLALVGCAGTGERGAAAPGPGESPGAGMPGGTVDEVAPDTGPDASPLTAANAPLPHGLDLDRDRVADTLDDCPDTDEDEVVDATGCALFSRVLEGVVFAPSDHRLGALSREALAVLVADLEAHPSVAVRIEGHTDNRGTALANLELSKQRVMSVARFLVASGIAPGRLKPYGFGESRPRAGNASEAGRERNRRIEIEQWRPPASLADPGGAGQNATDAE